MSTVQPTDKVLVQRGTTQHSAPADMSTLQDTDLILVNRAGIDYSCTFADWKAGFNVPPAITSVTLSDSPEAGRFTSGTFRSVVVMGADGKPASTKGIKAYVQGTLTTTPQTGPVTRIEHQTITLPNFSSILKDMTGTGDSSSDAKMFSAAQPDTAYIRPGLSPRGHVMPGLSFTGLPGGGIMCYHSLRLYARTTPAAPTDTDYIAFNVDPTYAPSNVRPPGPTAIVGNYKPIIGSWSSSTGYDWVDFPITAPVLIKNLVVVGMQSGTPANAGDDMGLTAIEVDGVRLTDNYRLDETILSFADSTGFSWLATYDQATQLVSGASGKIASVDIAKNQIHFNSYLHTRGTFVTGQPLKTAPKTIANAKRFCKLNAGLTVTDLQSADPGYTTVTGAGPYTVTFPATLPSGAAPDVDLPVGTSLTIEVEAKNTSTTVHKASNTVVPA